MSQHNRSLSWNSYSPPTPMQKLRHSSPPTLQTISTEPVAELEFCYERLFGTDMKVKDGKVTRFHLIFNSSLEVTLTTKDRQTTLASLHNKKPLSDIFPISTPNLTNHLLPTVNPNTNRNTILSRRKSANDHIRPSPLHLPTPPTSLLFSSICQTSYPIQHKGQIYTWRPLLIGPSWILVNETSQVTIAKFKRRALERRVGSLLLYTPMIEPDLTVFITALGYILYRHFKKPLY